MLVFQPAIILPASKIAGNIRVKLGQPSFKNRNIEIMHRVIERIITTHSSRDTN